MLRNFANATVRDELFRLDGQNSGSCNVSVFLSLNISLLQLVSGSHFQNGKSVKLQWVAIILKNQFADEMI